MIQCGIYLIRHRVSGKSYVGQSIDVSRRWSEHRSSKSENSLITRALRKHGRKMFEFVVLEECGSDRLNERETYFIKKLSTLAPRGYNRNEGGDARGIVCDDTRRKLSEQQRRVQSLPENRRRQSESNRATWRDPDLRAKASTRARDQWANTEQRERVIAGNQKPDAKVRKSRATASRWQTDLSYRERMLVVLAQNRSQS